MIKIENVEVYGFETGIRGMRNPMNSWDKSDSFKITKFETLDFETGDTVTIYENSGIGPNDLELMRKLGAAGNDHGKFLRMICVFLDITAPLYWWKEFDTYKVGTVANSCSTMHKIHSKPIELSDFSIDDISFDGGDMRFDLSDCFKNVIADCEMLRLKFIETKDKKYWRALIQLLPESYNQRRTVMLNYAVLKNMYHARKNHKLDEWRSFCEWIETLPYAKELITV